jgi:hypothetical protein
VANARVSGAVRQGLAKKPYSTGLGILSLTSTGISVLSGWLLAFDFLGYHAPGRPPHPEISSLLLLLGLFLATLGQLLGAGRNEGIRARGWVGVIDVLLMRLAFAGFVFMVPVLILAMRGKRIGLYPVGVLTIVSGFFLASRLLTKYVFHMDDRRRTNLILLLLGFTGAVPSCLSCPRSPSPRFSSLADHQTRTRTLPARSPKPISRPPQKSPG